MLSYGKLWILLEKKGMKRTDLKEIMSGNTLAKLGKNETVSSDIIEKICAFLNCQPGDIMEYISPEQMQAVMTQFDQINKVLADSLKEQGITEEQFATMMQEAMPEMIKSIYNGGTPMTDALAKSLEDKKE